MITTEAPSANPVVHPMRGVHNQVLRAAVLLVVIALSTAASAQPARRPPIVNPGGSICPEATLPWRIAAVQTRDATSVGPVEWVTLHGLDVADPVLVPNRRDAAIYVFVLLYRSRSPVEIEVSITPFGATEPTWRQAVSTGSQRSTGGFNLFPVYVATEVDRRDFSTAFPVDGPYRLEARPVRHPESAYVDGFCAAETTSWALVLRR